MNMRRLIGTALAAIGLFTATPAHSQTGLQDEMTLEDALRLVLEHNHSLREAEEAIGVFRARVDEARSALLPHAVGTASYTRLGPISELSVPDLGTFPLYPANNYDINAGVRQLVYDFHRTKESVELSRSQVTLAVDRTDLLRRDLAFETARLFYSILFLQDNIRVQAEHIRTFRDHLLLTEKKVAAGTATELDTLNTRVRVAAAENIQLDLENNLEKQLIMLRRLMGFEEKSALVLRGGFTYQPVSLAPEALLREALAKRLEARSVRNQIRAAEIQSRLADKNDSPSLGVAVLAGAKNGFFPGLNSMKLNYVAAVQADVPLFDGNRTKALRAESAANIKALGERNREVVEMIQSEVRQAVSDVRTNEEKLKSVEINVEQAQKALDYARTRYEAGTITNLDLLDTEDDRVEAEFMRNAALYRFSLSRLVLDRSVGNPVATAGPHIVK
jgi:outer membrane protein